jgi:hypothetical protein
LSYLLRPRIGVNFLPTGVIGHQTKATLDMRKLITDAKIICGEQYWTVDCRWQSSNHPCTHRPILHHVERRQEPETRVIVAQFNFRLVQIG